jgi:hypothetical protein
MWRLGHIVGCTYRQVHALPKGQSNDALQSAAAPGVCLERLKHLHREWSNVQLDAHAEVVGRSGVAGDDRDRERSSRFPE